MGSMISALRQRVEALVDAEIRHAIRRLPRLDEESRAQIEQMRRRIASKLLHSPTMALKSHQSPQVAQLVSELFDLDLAGGPKPRGAPASGQPASAVGERPEQGIGHG
jgi:glutamyl-tRNA reductase